MIRCKPNGICSWDFLLDGDGHHAFLEFNWLSEQGAITADGVPFEIKKHGMLSGHWTLGHAGKEVAFAQKSTPFTRAFEIQDAGGAFLLRAESPLGRSYRAEQSGDAIATFYPDHPFTRRATIEILAPKWDFATVTFSFWLVVLTWRRAAKSNS